MHRGATRRGRKKAQPQKVRCLSEMALGSLQPRGGASATLTCPNLRSPGRAVINYWAAYTWDELGFIECHTTDLGNKSLDSKQTHCSDAFRLLMLGWQLSLEHGSMLTRNEQTSSNEQTTTPWSISETNDHNNMKTNIISDRWLVLQSVTKHLRSRLRPRLSCTFVPLLCSRKDDNFLCGKYKLWKNKNALMNNSFLLLRCFVCIYCTEAGHSSCRKPSLCLWLEEEKVNTAKIKMDLRLGGPSNTVQ